MSVEETQAYNSPFKDRGHRAALHAFPPMVPEHEKSAGADISRQALHFWRERWDGQSMMAIGLQDPVLGQSVMDDLRQNIRNCPAPMLLPHAGHFVQEHGQIIAEFAVQHFKLSSS
jgi:tRNA(adenine34) deaminase